jgi:hypothetical protein
MIIPLNERIKQQLKKLKPVAPPKAPKAPKAPRTRRSPKNQIVVSKTKLEEIQKQMKKLMKPCKSHQQRNPKTNRCKNKTTK